MAEILCTVADFERAKYPSGCSSAPVCDQTVQRTASGSVEEVTLRMTDRLKPGNSRRPRG